MVEVAEMVLCLDAFRSMILFIQSMETFIGSFISVSDRQCVQCQILRLNFICSKMIYAKNRITKLSTLTKR